MYVEVGTSNSWRTTSPFDAWRYRSMTACTFQTCFWNDVVRAAVIFAGADSFAMSGMVVAVGAHVTDLLPVSLSVISFHSVPPHCGPGDATCAPAGSAKRAAVTAAIRAAAAKTDLILGPPEGWIERPQRTTESSTGRRTTKTLKRVTPLAEVSRPGCSGRRGARGRRPRA